MSSKPFNLKIKLRIITSISRVSRLKVYGEKSYGWEGGVDGLEDYGINPSPIVLGK